MRYRAAAPLPGALAGLIFASAAIAAAPATTKQATYDAAQAALDRQDWAAAQSGFATLLPTDPAASLDRSRAVIAAELAEALVHLKRLDEARVWADRAIKDLPAGDTMIPGAWLTMGDAARFAYDYSGAVAAYDKAASLAIAAGDQADADSARLKLAYAAVTVDAARAAAVLDAVLAEPAPGRDKNLLAEIEDMRARAAINAGDRVAAVHWIDRALDHSGGLTARVSFLQSSIRGDAAIIQRLRGDDELTRTYLTYTGAGHMKDMSWVGHFDGELPVCGVDGDVRPEDSAVVQFVLEDDGTVDGALPVYASRGGEVGATFARAVSAWRWEPARLTGVNAFWRSTLRLELRCVSRPAPESLGRPYIAQVIDWLVAKNLVKRGDVAEAAGHRDVVVMASDDPIVRALFGDSAIPRSDRPSYAEAQALLDAAHAPPSAYALLVTKQGGLESSASVRAAERASAAAMVKLAPAVTQRFPDDPSSAWLTLENALALEAAGEFADAQPLIRAVLATPETVLPANDPLRRVALLHKALILTKLKDAAGARTSLAESGLDAGQCALFDVRPIPASVAISSASFPQEAIRWHFQGYVREAFDITNDGHVANVRTIVAYPPFIFGPSTESATRSFRYVPPSIDGKPVGCSGQTQAVNYRLPG